MPIIRAHQYGLGAGPIPSFLTGLPRAYSQDGSQIDRESVDSRLRWLSGRQHGLAILVRRLLTLVEEEAEEGEATEPSQYAIAKVLELLHEAYAPMERVFPRGWPIITPEGGIRIEWSRSGRHVRLVIASNSDGQSYIYHEAGDDYGLDRNISGPTLARHLDWLTEG